MSIYDCHSIESKILAMIPIFNVHVYSRLYSFRVTRQKAHST